MINKNIKPFSFASRARKNKNPERIKYLSFLFLFATSKEIKTVIKALPKQEETFAIVKGNKALGEIEVKLQDFIEFETIGQGAGGIVVKAVHTPTKKLIAMKKI